MQNQKKLNEVIKRIKPKTIFHLASSYLNPPNLKFNDHINSNVLLTLNLLIALKKNKTKNFIFTNTSAIYSPGINLKENAKINCPSEYSLSKNITAELIKSFSKNYNFFYKDLRLFSIYGKWEKKNRLVCGAIDKALKNKKYIVHSDNQVRDYLNVADVVDAILLSTNVEKNLTLNICSNKSQKTHSLVSKIFKLMNRDSKLVLIKIGKTNFNKITKMVGNNKKATISLKWKPKISFELGIKSTIEWLEANKKFSRYL
jgi:dTDP-glucose 4,6-dehydratase